MVVSGVVVAPGLGAREGEVPELVNQVPHSLLLTLQPDVVAVPRHKELWLVERVSIVLENLQLSSQLLR